jgi:hypothetical protein
VRNLQNRETKAGSALPLPAVPHLSPGKRVDEFNRFPFSDAVVNLLRITNEAKFRCPDV